jgi:hypothetical protein
LASYIVNAANLSRIKRGGIKGERTAAWYLEDRGDVVENELL